MRLGTSGFGADELTVTERIGHSSKQWEEADGQATERPQVLAQLAKDISDLIHSARGSAVQPRARGPEPFPIPEQPIPAPWERAAASAATTEHSFAAVPLSTLQAFQASPMEPLSLQVAAATAEREHAAAASSAFASRSAELEAPHIARVASVGSSLRDEMASRTQMGARSPREVQFLLSSIESREAALHAKVQQLAEEKAAQQQRLEEEVRALQRSNAQMEAELRNRSNAQMEAELRMRQRAESELFNKVDSNKDGIISRPELANALREGVLAPSVAAPEGPLSRPRSPMEDRTEQSSLVQDTREELQQQLAEIRSEVARCASALCADEPLPTSEVADIRQQLAALSSEVMQTSRALLSTSNLGAHGQGTSRDSELAEVRGQLEALQGQVSRAMYASLSRPGVRGQQQDASPQASELSELRAEVGQLRAEIARGGHPASASHARPEIQDLGSQIESLRMELGGFVGGLCSVQPQPMPRPEARHHLPREPQMVAREPQMVAREPQMVPTSNAEAAGLQERLSWLRAEVARVVQDPRYAEDSAPPELRNRLGALLHELQDLRQGAEMVAAAAVASGGSPVPRRMAPSMAGLMAPPGVGVLRETELRFPKGQPLPSLSRARSSTPSKNNGFTSGFLRPDPIAANPSRFVNAGPTVSTAGDWAAGPSLRCGPPAMLQPGPVIGVPTAPVLVCPHVAADIAADQAGDAARYAPNRYADRYVDRECLAGDGVTRGVGMFGDTAASATPTLARAASSSTPSLGKASASGAPSLSGPSIFQQMPGTTSGSVRSWTDSPVGNSTAAPPMPASVVPAPAPVPTHTTRSVAPAVNGSSRQAPIESQPCAWGTHTAPSWPSSAGPGFPPNRTLVAATAESLSAPADEPPDMAPQGNMWRPMRSKISRP